MSRYKTGWSSRSGGWMIHNLSTIRDTGIGSGVELSGARAKKGTATSKTFEEIRDECVAQGQLWEDPDFPATDSSIYFKNPPSVWPGLKWMRPKVHRPTLVSFETFQQLLGPPISNHSLSMPIDACFCIHL